MMALLHTDERDAFVFHIVFSAACIPVLLIPGLAVGWKLFLLVSLYNIALPVTSAVRGHREWLDIWLFSLALSVFQVFPDWFLSAQLEVLVFPDDGFVKIGSVSGYMAGLWTIPVFIIVYCAGIIARRSTFALGYLAAAILALVIFGISEATVWMLPSWYARNVHMAGHVALYIIVPEIILGIACLYAYRQAAGKPHWVKIPFAFLVMLLYLGSASFFYFIVERVVL